MIDTTIGTGTPTITPIVPPAIAPQNAFCEPPYCFVKRFTTKNSMISATVAMSTVSSTTAKPISFITAPTATTPIMIHSPGKPIGIVSSAPNMIRIITQIMRASSV